MKKTCSSPIKSGKGQPRKFEEAKMKMGDKKGADEKRMHKGKAK